VGVITADQICTRGVLLVVLFLLTPKFELELTCFLADSSILRYHQISSLAQPKDSERDVINTWINSPGLNGGGWHFFGRDLAAIPTAVYEAVHTKDLVILHGSEGENDALTDFICGPALDAFHAMWKGHKVDRMKLFLRGSTDADSKPVPRTEGSRSHRTKQATCGTIQAKVSNVP
jgi:hypothetical protein